MSRVLPILFNGDMVRAILDGRKTVTRRICKDANELTVPDMSFYDADKRTYAVHNYADKEHTDKLSIAERTCPICPGDIMYVRETWKCWRAHRYEATADIMFRAGGDGVQLQFANGNTDSIDRFDYDTFVNKWFSHREEWKPSLFMPKEAARIWLKVKDVRVERLQEMENENDQNYIAEGAKDKHDFIRVWDSTVSDREHYGWYANPWVWVIEFERCENPDAV